jgi:hypothetical protein
VPPGISSQFRKLQPSVVAPVSVAVAGAVIVPVATVGSSAPVVPSPPVPAVALVSEPDWLALVGLVPVLLSAALSSLAQPTARALQNRLEIRRCDLFMGASSFAVHVSAALVEKVGS